MDKEQQKKLVKGTVELQQTISRMTVDEINQAPDVEPETQLQLTAKQLAAKENCLYIEPKKTLPPVGTLPEKQRKAHDYDWQYVKGILENFVISGEGVEFWYKKYPGDQDCLWHVPCNVPVYVPRMIAKHLEETMKYHSFEVISRPQEKWQKDQFAEDFRATGTQYRAKMRAVEAFN